MRKVFLVVATVAMLTGFNACKAKKSIDKVTGAQEIELPFSEKAYQTDKDYFRAKNTGKSPDLATSKKIAMQNAKSEVASSIQSTIKKVTDQYTNQRTVGDKQEFENKFEELAREVVNQTLNGVKIIGEKTFKETDGRYTYWIALEVSKESVLNGVDGAISKNAKIQLDYDKKKFQEIMDQEMSKMENER